MNIQCGNCVRGLTPQHTLCETCKGTAVIEVQEVKENKVEKTVTKKK